MLDKKVSIIVPIYNSEAYLPMCIESIMNQTYKNIEILLIDDGSTDASLEICKKYATTDKRINTIHQENKGVSAARNAGLDAMTGEFYFFIDSDDTLTKNAIEILMNDVLEYNADITSAVFSTVQEDGSIVNIYEDNALNIYTHTDMLRLSLAGDHQTHSACAKLYKHSVFRNLRFMEGRSINEDGFYLFQCYTLKPTVVQHNVCVYLYYTRQDSNSRSAFSKKYFDILYFCEQKKHIINTYFPELSHELIQMEVRAHLCFLGVLYRTNDKKYLGVQRSSIDLVKKNYKHFTCINKYERKMAWIVAHGLYPLYKAAVRFKYYR